jgi:hypothetical protein
MQVKILTFNIKDNFAKNILDKYPTDGLLSALCGDHNLGKGIFDLILHYDKSSG